MPRMVATSIKPSKLILAENLTRLLNDRGRGSARRLAESIGWPETRISDLKHARAGNPDTATLDLVADGLNITVAELLQENL